MRLLKKLLFLYLPLFLLVLTTAFVLLQMSPGNPALSRTTGTENEYSGNDLNTLESEKQWDFQHGMHLPYFYFSVYSWSEKEHSIGHWLPSLHFNSQNRFHRWLVGEENSNSGILRGEFGNSFRNNQSVTDIIRPRIMNTLILSITSLLLAFLVAIPGGLVAAIHPSKYLYRSLDYLSIVLLSVPSFLLATVFAIVFTDKQLLGWLPAPGSWPLATHQSTDQWSHWVLPIFTFTLTPAAFLFRWIRSNATTELSKEYVLTARSKGASEKSVLYLHVLRNLAPEILTLTGQIMPAVLSGSILIETVFALPGMGWTIFQAVSTTDIPLLSALFLLYSTLAITTYSITDLLALQLDPRHTNRKITS